jgi:hypothetical protein
MSSRLSFSAILFHAASFAGFMTVLVATSSNAASILATPHASESDLDGILGSAGYSHSASIADLNANQSFAETFVPLGANAEVRLLLEDAGFRNHNELGIYSILDNGRTATLFDASDSAPNLATLVFGATGLEVVNGVAIAAGFGGEFGFYLKNDDEGFVWYSETARNGDGYDHFAVFEEGDSLWAGIEDLPGGGDQDFNDLVIRLDGVASGVVPEPTASLVFSAGLLVVSQVVRRRSRIL